jgi:predicted  nucleic acid-binding Zn-ribbon protein
MKKFLTVLLLLVTICGWDNAFAYDDFGCQLDQKTKKYVCVTGLYAGATFSSQMAMFYTMRDQLIAAKATIKTLNAQIVTLNSQITSLQTQITALTTQVADLQTQLADATTGDIAALQAQLAAANATITDLQTQVAAKDAQITTLNAQITTLNSQVTGLTTQVASLQAQLLQLQQDTTAKLAEKDASINSLNTQLAALNGQIITLSSENTTLKAQVVTLQGQITTLQSQVTAKDAQIASLTTQVTSLTTENTNLKAQVASLTTQLAACKTNCPAPPPPTPTYSCQGPQGPCNSIDGHVYTLTQFNATGLGGWKFTIDGVAVGCDDNAALRIGVDPYAGHIQLQQGPKHCDGTVAADAGHWYDIWNGQATDVTNVTTPPPPVTGGVSAEVGTASLAWDASSDTVLGYRVWYGTTAGSYDKWFDAKTALTAKITGLTSGTRYYFAVVAYITGADSAYSNEVNIVAK